MKKNSVSSIFSGFCLASLLAGTLALADGSQGVHQQQVARIESDHYLFQGRAVPVSALISGEGEEQELQGIQYQNRKIWLKPAPDQESLGEGVIPMGGDLYGVEVVQGWPLDRDSYLRHPEMDPQSFHFRPGTSAKVTLTFLEDAQVFGGSSYLHIPLELRRGSDGHWSFFDQKGRAVSTFFARRKQGAIGVGSVEFRESSGGSVGCSQR